MITCVSCGRKRKHKARGMCGTCYRKALTRGFDDLAYTGDWYRDGLILRPTYPRPVEA